MKKVTDFYWSFFSAEKLAKYGSIVAFIWLAMYLLSIIVTLIQKQP